MEKLVYLGWAAEGRSNDDLRDHLLGATAPALAAGGAVATTISVADERVSGDGVFSFSSEGDPKDALVSFWLEVSADRAWAESLLSEAFGTLHGYLVCESTPLVAAPPARPGDRSEGATQITCVAARPDLTHTEFVERWQGPLCRAAIECQQTLSYVRNEVVRPLTPDAPDWWAIVEEAFPIEALTDPEVFYDAEGDPEALAANQARLFDAVGEVIDLARVDARFFSEFRFDSGFRAHSAG
ncbi:MAG: EthD domain-containing protein [Microthrixaceae bacterium]